MIVPGAGSLSPGSDDVYAPCPLFLVSCSCQRVVARVVPCSPPATPAGLDIWPRGDAESGASIVPSPPLPSVCRVVSRRGGRCTEHGGTPRYPSYGWELPCRHPLCASTSAEDPHRDAFALFLAAGYSTNCVPATEKNGNARTSAALLCGTRYDDALMRPAHRPSHGATRSSLSVTLSLSLSLPFFLCACLCLSA